MVIIEQLKKTKMIPAPKCFCCKSQIGIDRKNYNTLDILYFDRHLYHTKCFLAMKRVKKVCFYCKKDINTDVNNNQNVYYDNHFYHKDCFVNWCNATKFPSKKRQMALLNIDTYINEANAAIEALLKEKNCSENIIQKYKNDAKKYIADWFSGSDLCSYLREEYNTLTIPWNKIREVINGESKKTDYAIPAEDLLEMWQRQILNLRKINDNLTKKSPKEITPSLLILYDLSVLINKYDSFLKWKEQQKILATEKKQGRVTPLCNYGDYKTNLPEKDTVANLSDNISDLVDDIFG